MNIRLTAPFQQWCSSGVMGRRALDPHSPYMDDDDLPMTGLSWVDAKAFVDLLNKRLGAKWQMPAEVQWEYAWRAGTSTPYSFDENTTPEFACYAQGQPRVIRGGSYTSSGALLRCANRDGYPPLASLGPKYGLRVALTLEEPAGSRNN